MKSTTVFLIISVSLIGIALFWAVCFLVKNITKGKGLRSWLRERKKQKEAEKEAEAEEERLRQEQNARRWRAEEKKRIQALKKLGLVEISNADDDEDDYYDDDDDEDIYYDTAFITDENFDINALLRYIKKTDYWEDSVKIEIHPSSSDNQLLFWISCSEDSYAIRLNSG